METNKSANNWIKAQIYLMEWQSANGKTPQIFTNLKIGDICWKRATLNIMTISPPILNSMYSKLRLMTNEQESLTDDRCRTKSCQDAVTCQIPIFLPRLPQGEVLNLAGYIPFFMSLTFAWTALSGFQSTETLIFA